MKRCSAAELKNRLDKGEAIRLLDVRLPEEVAFCNLAKEAPLLHIPLHELPGRYQEVSQDAQWVVYCHHGIRSAQAINFLQQHGFQHLENLEGGIHAWSTEVDPQVPVY
jgi:rhodanese-related sulfurtransferase